MHHEVSREEKSFHVAKATLEKNSNVHDMLELS
jgi:hypothetical protein